MNNIFKLLVAVLFLTAGQSAFAVLEIEITQGRKKATNHKN